MLWLVGRTLPCQANKPEFKISFECGWQFATKVNGLANERFGISPPYKVEMQRAANIGFAYMKEQFVASWQWTWLQVQCRLSELALNFGSRDIKKRGGVNLKTSRLIPKFISYSH